MSANSGKTVREILKSKRGAIKYAPLDAGSPGWDEILDMPWEELEARSDRGEPGYRTFKKLLKDGRFNK